MDPNDPRIRRGGLALGVLVVALALVDSIALRGDPVMSGSASLRPDSSPVQIDVTRPGEKHLVRITTRRTVRGETRGKSIAYRLLDPEGRTVAEESEALSHKVRSFTFVPDAAGSYALYTEETTLIGNGRGSAFVEVTVNDHRVLSRLLGF